MQLPRCSRARGLPWVQRRFRWTVESRLSELCYFTFRLRRRRRRKRVGHPRSYTGINPIQSPDFIIGFWATTFFKFIYLGFRRISGPRIRECLRVGSRFPFRWGLGLFFLVVELLLDWYTFFFFWRAKRFTTFFQRSSRVVSSWKQTWKRSTKLVRAWSIRGKKKQRESSSSSFLFLFAIDSVQEAARARKDSYTSSNPLSLGGSGLTPRGANTKTPLGWITGKLTGSGAR